MKAWNWTLILLVIVAYFVGAKFGGFGRTALGKVGL